MSTLRVSDEAEADVDAILDYLYSEAGSRPANRFMESWAHCLTHIAEHPEAGSPRLASKLAIPTLRVWPIKGFPYLALYVSHHQSVTLIRVLHTSRDIPTSLRD